MEHLFYIFFWPQTALAEWTGYMVHGIASSIILSVLGATLYFFLPYNRNKEPVKFFATFSIVLLLSLIFILWQTTTIPDEITRGNDKIYYVLNHVLSTTILEVVLFSCAGQIHGGRKYFSRLWEYFKK